MRSALPSAVAIAACAAALSACGSSGNKGTNASSFRNAGLKFAACMRTHGVPNMPDPSSGGGIQFSDKSGINPGSPAFQTAQKDCRQLLPGGGPGGGSPAENARRKQMLVKLAECMRAHGIKTFPDPTSGGPPSAPPSGGGIAFGSPGAFISVSQTMIQSPGFRQAASACGFPGAGGIRGKVAPVPPGG